jgi:hypothetical protein
VKHILKITIVFILSVATAFAQEGLGGFHRVSHDKPEEAKAGEG